MSKSTNKDKTLSLILIGQRSLKTVMRLLFGVFFNLHCNDEWMAISFSVKQEAVVLSAPHPIKPKFQLSVLCSSLETFPWTLGIILIAPPTGSKPCATII